MSTRQREIWNRVTEIQSKLASNLGAPVAAPTSRSSLQLALENGGLERAQADYVKALQPLGEKDDDIVGYIFAVNGKINSADIYPSNGLFRKMWPKLLRASATEALTDRDGTAAPAPPVSEASGFLASPSAARQRREGRGLGRQRANARERQDLVHGSQAGGGAGQRLGASQLSGQVTGPDEAAPPRVPSPGVAPRMPERGSAVAMAAHDVGLEAVTAMTAARGMGARRQGLRIERQRGRGDRETQGEYSRQQERHGACHG